MRRAAKGLGELGERTRSVSRARGRERLKSMGAVAKLASGEGEEPEQCGRLEPGKGLDPGGLSGRECVRFAAQLETGGGWLQWVHLFF